MRGPEAERNEGGAEGAEKCCARGGQFLMSFVTTAEAFSSVAELVIGRKSYPLL